MGSRPWMLDPTPFSPSLLLRRPSGPPLSPPGAGYYASECVTHRKLGSMHNTSESKEAILKPRFYFIFDVIFFNFKWGWVRGG